MSEQLRAQKLDMQIIGEPVQSISEQMQTTSGTCRPKVRPQRRAQPNYSNSKPKGIHTQVKKQ
eukprot:1754702-Amphidinium_carterae.1